VKLFAIQTEETMGTRNRGIQGPSFVCLIAVAALISLVLGEVAGAQEGVVPITTSSPEARDLFIKARDLLDNAHSAEARKLLEDAIGKDPSFLMALYFLSSNETTADKGKRRLDQAVSLLDKVKVSDGERLWVQSAEAGWKGDLSKQRELMESLVKAYPKDRWARMALAWQLSGTGEHEKAVDQLRKLTELAPDFAPAYNSLGLEVTAHGKNYEEGEKALKKYTELVPKEPNAWDSYAALLMKEGKFDESIVAYQKALDLDPKFCFSLQGQGFAKVLKGKAADGRKNFEQLLKAAPDDWWRNGAQYALAASYLLEGKFDQAVQEENKALTLFEKSKDFASMANVHGNIAYIYIQQGNAKESKAQILKFIDAIEKSNLPVENKTLQKVFASAGGEARVALLAKDLKTAKQKAQDFKAGVEKSQVAVWLQTAHLLSGLIAMQEKRLDDAIAELSQANPRSTEAMINLGDAYLAKGDKEKAREMWTKAANFNELDLEFALMRPVALQKLSEVK